MWQPVSIHAAKFGKNKLINDEIEKKIKEIQKYHKMKNHQFLMWNVSAKNRNLSHFGWSDAKMAAS